MKMKFKEDNEVLYGQDFSVYRGIPTNIEFDAKIIYDNNKNIDKLVLRADGYGVIGGNYGNGALYVYFSHLNWKSQKLIKEYLESHKEENIYAKF